MAASRDTRNGPDAVDVRYVLEAFQHINSCVLEVKIRVSSDGREPCLSYLVTAHDARAPIGDLPALASRSFLTGSSDRRTMEAAILQALYGLDADLGAKELAKVKTK